MQPLTLNVLAFQRLRKHWLAILGFRFGDFQLASANRAVGKLRILALGAVSGSFIAGFDGSFGSTVSDPIFGSYAVQLAGGFGFSIYSVLAAVHSGARIFGLVAGRCAAFQRGFDPGAALTARVARALVGGGFVATTA